jgi:hypothetical protein
MKSLRIRLGKQDHHHGGSSNHSSDARCRITRADLRLGPLPGLAEDAAPLAATRRASFLDPTLWLRHAAAA